MWNRRHGEDGDTPTCSIFYINNSCQTARFCAPSCQSHLKNFQDSATTPTHSRTGTQYTYIQAILQNILDHASKMKEESLVKDPPLPARPWNSSF